VYNPSTNTMTVFGGANTASFFSDVFVLMKANGL
jgi:hypothetical protein